MKSELSRNIKLRRIGLGYSQQDLADILNEPLANVKRWELGTEPRDLKLYEIAKALETTVAELYGVKTCVFGEYTEEETINCRTVQEVFNLRLQKQIGYNFKRLRCEHGYTQSALSNIAGIRMNLICSLEAGNATTKEGNPTTKTFSIKYCDKLGEIYGMTSTEVVNELLKPISDKEYDYMTVAEYPTNLVCDIFGDYNIDIHSINYKKVLGAVKSLRDRESMVLELRYRYGMTLEEIGRELNVTRERARQILAKALRRLRHPAHRKYFFYVQGEEYDRVKQENNELKQKIREYETFMGKIESDTTKHFADITLEELEFSVRTYNCLHRYGVRTLEDFLGMTDIELMKVRNLGKKSLEEVISKASEYGIVIKRKSPGREWAEREGFV